MASEIEIRERHRALLGALLRVKKDLTGMNVQSDQLQEEIKNAVLIMISDDVAVAEKIYEVKAID
jgi:hypothetical protein